jgi:predicted transporter
MIGYSYIYKTSDEILQSVSHLGSMSISDILLLITMLIVVVLSIFVMFPCISITLEYKRQKKEKINKKKILTQILLQKEIEDEVEKEIQIE